MLSIEDNGLLHPIIVRPAGDKFEVVAGHRRFYACKRLRWARVPVQVIEADDKEAFELALTENLQHETLSPVEIAFAFKKYVDEYGYGGISELARHVGKSEQYVSQYMQLLRLPKSVIARVSNHSLNLAQARELFTLSQGQQKELAKMIQKEKVTSRQVKVLAAAMKAEGGADLPFLERKTYSDSERRMHESSRILGKCIASLKVCMMRFDELIEQIDDDEFILKEALTSHRAAINHQIDGVIRLRKRIRQALL